MTVVLVLAGFFAFIFLLVSCGGSLPWSRRGRAHAKAVRITGAAFPEVWWPGCLDPDYDWDRWQREHDELHRKSRRYPADP